MDHRRTTYGLELPVENGTISAQTLTLDKETAARPFETITFGLG